MWTLRWIQKKLLLVHYEYSPAKRSKVRFLSVKKKKKTLQREYLPSGESWGYWTT